MQTKNRKGYYLVEFNLNKSYIIELFNQGYTMPILIFDKLIFEQKITMPYQTFYYHFKKSFNTKPQVLELKEVQTIEILQPQKQPPKQKETLETLQAKVVESEKVLEDMKTEAMKTPETKKAFEAVMEISKNFDEQAIENYCIKEVFKDKKDFDFNKKVDWNAQLKIPQNYYQALKNIGKDIIKYSITREEAWSLAFLQNCFPNAINIAQDIFKLRDLINAKKMYHISPQPTLFAKPDGCKSLEEWREYKSNAILSDTAKVWVDKLYGFALYRSIKEFDPIYLESLENEK